MSTSNGLEIRSSVRGYTVLFVDDFSEAIAKDCQERPAFLIVDQSVYHLYHEQLEKVLQSKTHLVVEATEEHKSLEYVEVVIKSLLNSSVRRNHTLVGVGGGIIQDITGFVASILFRGIDWVFYPSTLLAQCDSCIGSKTSLNVGEFKNQLGTYYPPARITVDANFLRTLSARDMKSGWGEMIKVHLLDGPASTEYIASCFDAKSAALDLDMLKTLTHRSLGIKKEIIERDEFDRDYRNILNYGHTFGHAIESITDYRVCHGESVTIGMDIANYLSLRLGMLPESSYEKMRVPIERNYPEFRLREEHIEPLLVALSRDKKNVDNDLVMILTKGPGEMFKTKIPFDGALEQYVNEYIRRGG